jgi:hypothetical protein
MQGALFAQSTWKGLRFGMSEVEIRKTYGAALRREVNGKQEAVLVDDSVELLGATLSVRARVELFLGKAGKLEVINIIAKSPFADEKNETNAGGSSLAAIEELTRRLVSKYGKPLTEEGQCGLTAEMLLSRKPALCNDMWKSEGENITMFWSVFDRRLKDFVLSYKPVPTDF